MSWATTIRQWWEELFYSTHIKHMEEEVVYLRNELAQVRIDRERLQLALTQMTVAITPRRPESLKDKLPNYNPNPGPKRSSQIEAERYADIATLRRAEAEKKQKETVSQSS
jgi:hypothetical protein